MHNYTFYLCAAIARDEHDTFSVDASNVVLSDLAVMDPISEELVYDCDCGRRLASLTGSRYIHDPQSLWVEYYFGLCARYPLSMFRVPLEFFFRMHAELL